MASKSSRKVDTSSFYNTEENIRKAKGNPNKNVHRRRNGSNYHRSYYLEQQEKQKKKEGKIWGGMSRSQRSWTFIIVAVVAVTLLLRMGVYPDSEFAGYVSFLVMGICCGLLFLLSRSASAKTGKGDSLGNVIINFLLLGIFVVYTGAGLMGLIRFNG